jgi:hypothetical protein
MLRLHAYNQAVITNRHLFSFSELTRAFVVDLLEIKQRSVKLLCQNPEWGHL